MSRVTARTEKWVWMNLKMYLMQHPTCLCDNILRVVDKDAEKPIDRYHDFFNSLEQHMGLGSYVIQQPTLFSNVPYITVNIEPYGLGNCNARAVVTFDIVFSTDVPADENGSTTGGDGSTLYVGNSSEAVASFRENILESLDALFYRAYDDDDSHYETQGFWDVLRDEVLENPANPEDVRQWKYNMRAQADPDPLVTEVYQLKKEDRQSGLSIFHVTYKLDINCLYEDDELGGCC